ASLGPSRRLGAEGDGHAIAVILEPPGAGQPDTTGPTRDEDDPLGLRAHRPHRMTTLAQVMPAPNPESNTWSPSRSRPASAASASASGIDPAELLPVRSSTTA